MEVVWPAGQETHLAVGDDTVKGEEMNGALGVAELVLRGYKKASTRIQAKAGSCRALKGRVRGA